MAVVNNRKSRPRRRRNPNAMPRRRKIGGTGSKLIEKQYKYKFTPNQAYLMNVTTAGLLAVSPLSSPLQFSIVSLPIASKTSFTGYYDFGIGIPFSLADLSNYTAYTSLYDNYKIDSINLELEYMKSDAGVVGVGLMPTVYALQDHDDVAIPTSISRVTGHQGHKRFTFGNKGQSAFRITIKLRVAATVYNGTSSTGVGFQQTQGWQDSLYPNNVYYGLKLWFTDVYLPGGTAVNTAFRWKWTYNVSFKGSLNAF